MGENYSSPRTFKLICRNKGLTLKLPVHIPPKKNGVAERKNRHLLEVTRALLTEMKVPNTGKKEAVLTACYLINRMPVLSGKSPI